MPDVVLPLFAPEAHVNQWGFEVSNAKYHADKTYVSSTDLRRIQKSPWSFYQAMKDATLPIDDEDESDAMRLGEIFHMAILEPKKFFSKYIRMPEFVGKTKDGRDSTLSASAKQMRAEWLEAQPKDAVILSDKEMMQVEGMVNSVLSHREVCGILKEGQAEVSGYYRDPTTGIQCKFRPDFLNLSLMTLVDVKTTRDCTHRAFQASIAKYGYYFQMAMYGQGVAQIVGSLPKYSIYLAVEKVPPYEVAIYVCDEAMLMKGQAEYEQALRTLYECILQNRWPKYQSNLQTISLPEWMTA